MSQNNLEGSAVDVLAVAKAQKGILWSLAGYLVGIAFFPLLLAAYFLSFYFTFRLVTSLKSQYTILWLICTLVPFLNILVLLALNSQATTAIKKAGFEVGFMGANVKDIKSKLSASAPAHSAVV